MSLQKKHIALLALAFITGWSIQGIIQTFQFHRGIDSREWSAPPNTNSSLQFFNGSQISKKSSTDVKKKITESASSAEASHTQPTKEEQAVAPFDSKEKINAVPHGGFDTSKNNPMIGGNDWMDGKVCAGIEKVVRVSTVGDFGCGLGQYGRCLMRSYDNLLNVKKKHYKTFEDRLIDMMKHANIYGTPKVIQSWEGYDGAAEVEYNTGGWVKQIDLAQPFDLGKRFDWVVSLEVGEHIPHEFEKHFVDNLVRHAKIGIILSWAVEGQGGHNHVNNHNNNYVIQEMQKRGLSHDQKSQDLIRSSTIYGYFRDTIMVFRK